MRWLLVCGHAVYEVMKLAAAGCQVSCASMHGCCVSHACQSACWGEDKRRMLCTCIFTIKKQA